MRLDHLLTQLVMENDLESCTVEQYKRVLRKFAEHLGHEPLVNDLTTNNVNAFLMALKAAGKAGTTCRNYRVSITRVWNYACEQGLCEPYNPRRLRSPKQERRPVLSWSPSQVAMLIAAAQTISSKLRCGIREGDFLAAWIRAGYDTGLRPVDLRLLRWTDIDLVARTTMVIQHKTGMPHIGRLSDIGLQLLDTIRKPDRVLVFPLSKGGVRRLEIKLFKIAESLGFTRLRGQGLGTLRKTHATQIYEQEGENAAAESLGHVGGCRTVRASYIDSRAIRSGRLPPPLVLPNLPDMPDCPAASAS